MARRIFHITHLDNLPGIIATGGLLSDHQVVLSKQDAQSIAHGHIKQRRFGRLVPLPPGGVVADYVPFYFAPRSPMLYAIFKGAVDCYQDGQESIIYLVADPEEVAEKCSFCFTDGHAAMTISKFFNRIEELADAVDWELMRAKMWNNTEEDGDRSRRRQAEFLVKDSFPWSLISEIIAFDQSKANHVNRILDDTKVSHRPALRVERRWYYQ